MLSLFCNKEYFPHQCRRMKSKWERVTDSWLCTACVSQMTEYLECQLLLRKCNVFVCVKRFSSVPEIVFFYFCKKNWPGLSHCKFELGLFHLKVYGVAEIFKCKRGGSKWKNGARSYNEKGIKSGRECQHFFCLPMYPFKCNSSYNLLYLKLKLAINIYTVRSSYRCIKVSSEEWNDKWKIKWFLNWAGSSLVIA